MSEESNWGPHDTVNPRDVSYVGSGSVWENGAIVSTIVQVSFPAGATSTLPARSVAIEPLLPWSPRAVSRVWSAEAPGAGCLRWVVGRGGARWSSYTPHPAGTLGQFTT